MKTIKKTRVTKGKSHEGDLFFSVDRNYCYTSFNAKYKEEVKKLYGTSVKKGACLLECITVPTIRKFAKGNADRVLKGEFFSTSRDLKEVGVVYDFVYSPVFNNKEVIGVNVFYRNVTEKEKAIKKLKESERKYRELVEN